MKLLASELWLRRVSLIVWVTAVALLVLLVVAFYLGYSPRFGDHGF